jgi:hypothetical protein
MYTACLLYADEDELMAQVITKLYKTAFKDALFFLPQFDLKQGKYVLDTTAKVIDERQVDFHIYNVLHTVACWSFQYR